jgi:hypothetical protein
MIYPATYDIVVLQNATWKNQFRATENQKQTTIDISGSTFTTICHGLSAGQKVVFAGGAFPCGMTDNTVYYIIASGLTNDSFKVSATSGGTSLALSCTASGTHYVSTPINLSGYTIDADIKSILNNSYVSTFSTSLVDEENGLFQLQLSPATTSGFQSGQFGYDVSLTSSGGERYYWLTGTITVQSTYSRN